jgi:hypothetical protein
VSGKDQTWTVSSSRELRHMLVNFKVESSWDGCSEGIAETESQHTARLGDARQNKPIRRLRDAKYRVAAATRVGWIAAVFRAR